MLVRDCMHVGVVTCPPTATLGEVAAGLVQHGVHALVVAEAGGRPLGLLSDMDLLAGEWLSADAASLAALRAMQAGELMTTPVATIAADAPIAEAAERIRAARIHRLLVVDGDASVGMISVGDLVASLGAGSARRATVADVMSHAIVVCREDTPLTAAARAMSARRSRSLVVVDATGRHLGVVTGWDLLPYCETGCGDEAVAQVMHPPKTIHPAASLQEAADVMIRHHVHRLVVVDPAWPDGMPIGVIATSDIVAEMAAPESVWRGR